MSPLTLMKSSCSKASRASSTLSHILASSWPLRSPSVSARYGSPVFLGLICLQTTTKVEVMTLFSWRTQSQIKNSFMQDQVWVGTRYTNSRRAAHKARDQAAGYRDGARLP